MKKVFDLDHFLNDAEREFLLEGRELFSYRVRLTKGLLSKVGIYEESLRQQPGLTIAGYSNRLLDGVWAGIPNKIEFDVNFLFEHRPNLRTIFESFKDARDAAKYLNLDLFLKDNFLESKKKYLSLSSAVRAVEYILEHRPNLAGLYPRQIPHGQSTKLLMENTLARRMLAFHYDRPQLTPGEISQLFGFRIKPSYFQFHADRIIYDGLELFNHHAIVTANNISRFNCSSIPRVLLVENSEVFHAAIGIFNGMIILGDGDRIANAEFLSATLKGMPIYYWGDIDKDGYEALDIAGRYFDQIIPVGMNMKTIEQFYHLNQPQAPQPSDSTSPLLGSEYARVCREGIRIEQEQLPIQQVLLGITNANRGTPR